MAYYVFTGTSSPENWAEEVALGEGRYLELGIPIELSDEEVAFLRADGHIIEPSSEQEAEAVQTAISDWLKSDVEGDLHGTAPLLGGLVTANSAESGNLTKEVK